MIQYPWDEDYNEKEDDDNLAFAEFKAMNPQEKKGKDLVEEMYETVEDFEWQLEMSVQEEEKRKEKDAKADEKMLEHPWLANASFLIPF